MDRDLHLLGAHPKHRRDEVQLLWLRNMARFDSKPLLDLHASQTGYYLQRKDAALSSLPHKDAEQLAPDLTNNLAGPLLAANRHTHIHNAPRLRPLSSNWKGAD